MRVLVTGGSGFIGSALVRHLVASGQATVLNVDALTYAANPASLAAVDGSPDYHFLQADITDGRAMTEALSNFSPDAVIHLAAESHVDRSIEGPGKFIETNVMGTGVLLDAARHYWQLLPEERKSRFRFHHVSTDEVYGDLSEQDPAFSEATPYRPSSPYSATKAGSDHLVRAWHRTFGLPVLITNCSNNYGPCQFPEKLIPHMIISLMYGKDLPVYGDGRQIRDWLHVQDHVEALLTVVKQGRPGETYNIGGNSERRNIEVIKAICSIFDQNHPGLRPPQVDSFHDLITHVTDRPGHDRRYAVDCTRLEQELGWRPRYSFENGLSDTVKWYFENRHWWEPIITGNYQLTRIGDGS